MSVRYRVQSENFWASVAAGGSNYWLHIDAGLSGRVVINPVTSPTGITQKPLILQAVTVNTTGAATPFVVTDSGQGVMASQKAAIQEKDYHYTTLVRASLYFDTNASDVTITYSRD